MEYEVRILGPIELRADGEPLALGRGHHRTLLGVLAADERGASIEALIDMLSTGATRTITAHNIHTALTRLRTLAPGAVVGNRDRYQLADDVAVDARRFESQVRDLATAGVDPQDVARTLDRALAMWRGDVLAGLPPHSELTARAARLRELRRGAVEQLAGALARLGRHDEAATMLEQQVTDEPLREHSWVLLIESYERLGQLDTATGTFDRARRCLAEQGLEVGLELRGVWHRLAAARAMRGASELAHHAFGGARAVSTPAVGAEPSTTSWVSDFVQMLTALVEAHAWPQLAEQETRMLHSVVEGSLAAPSGVRGLALALLSVADRPAATRLIEAAMAEERVKPAAEFASFLEHLAWFRIGAEVAEVAAELEALGRSSGEPAIAGIGALRAWCADVQCGTGRLDDEQRATTLASLVEGAGDATLTWEVSMWTGARRMALGDLAGAAASIAASERVIPAGAVGSMAALRADGVARVVQAQRLALALFQGDFATMEELFARLSVPSSALMPLAAAPVIAAAYGGRPDIARARVDELVRHGLLRQQRSMPALTCLAIAAGGIAPLGDQLRAVPLLRALEPYRGVHVLFGRSAYLGAVEHHLGMLHGSLDDLDGAAELLEEALERHIAVGAAIYVGMSQWQLAQVLWRRDRGTDRERAEHLRTTAHAAASGKGLGVLTAATERGFARRQPLD